MKEIFDKSKAPNENSKTELVETRTTLQLLQQRVSDMNDSMLSKDKFSQLLPQITSLRS